MDAIDEWSLRLWELQVIRVTFIPANGAPVKPRNVYLDISSDTQPPRCVQEEETPKRLIAD
jgi:hypothetical protein